MCVRGGIRTLTTRLGLDADPVGRTTWYALLAEMRLAAGTPDAAAAALDQADSYRDRYGQRSADGLHLLVRAQLAKTLADPGNAVRLAEQARAVAERQEAYVFVQRAVLGRSRIYASRLTCCPLVATWWPAGSGSTAPRRVHSSALNRQGGRSPSPSTSSTGSRADGSRTSGPSSTAMRSHPN
jgi:hypothetical protein